MNPTGQLLPKIGGSPVGKFEISDVASIADLRAINTGSTFAGADTNRPALEDGSFANVLGYYTKNDGGGGVFVFDAYSIADDDGGFTIAPDNGLGRWIRQTDGKPTSLKWFGAKGDGVTDDTAAIQTAFNSSMDLYAPDGTFLTDPLELGFVLNPNTGLLDGKRLRGAGVNKTIFKAKGGAGGGIPNILLFVGNPNYFVDGLYCVGNSLSNFSVDTSNMTDDTDHYGIYLRGTYNNILRNIKLSIADEPHSRWDLAFSRGTYTTNIHNVHGKQLNIASDTNDRVTTLTFIGCSFTFINIAKSLAITFINPTIQGTVQAGYQANRVQISESYNVQFIGGDLEGTGTVFNIANCDGIHVEKNNVAVNGQYNNPGVTNSVMFNIANSTRITSKDNIFMNWAPAGTYLVDGGGNSKLALNDLWGNYFLGVSYTCNAGQALASAVMTIINFADLYSQSDGGLVTTGAAWKFTAPVAGTYRVKASALFEGVAADVKILAVFVNGAEVRRAWAANLGSGEGFGFVDCNIQLAAGDYVDIRGYSNNAAPTIGASATGNAVEITLIGNK